MAAGSVSGAGGSTSSADAAAPISFDEHLSAQLRDLHKWLQAAHRRTVRQFEGRLASLAAENTRLRSRLEACGAAFPEERRLTRQNSSKQGAFEPSAAAASCGLLLAGSREERSAQESSRKALDNEWMVVSHSEKPPSTHSRTESVPLPCAQAATDIAALEAASPEAQMPIAAGRANNTEEVRSVGARISIFQARTFRPSTLVAGAGLGRLLPDPSGDGVATQGSTLAPTGGLQQEHAQFDTFDVNPLWLKSSNNRLAKRRLHRSQSQSLENLGAPQTTYSRGSWTIEEITPTPAEDVETAPTKWSITVTPGSIRLFVWELLGLLGVGFDFVFVPLGLMDMPEPDIIYVVYKLFRWYWTFDVILSFFKGYIDSKGHAVADLRRVVKMYLKTWFCVDICVLVCDWVEAQTGDGRHGSLNFLRLLRLLRMFKARQITGLVKQYVQSEEVILVACILRVIALLSGACHLTASFWYSVGRIGSYDQPGWVVTNQVDIESPLERYTLTFHWSLAALSGNLVVVPTTVAERTFTCFILVLFFMFSAGFVSTITTSMTRLQIIASQDSTHFAALRRYLDDNGVSLTLATKVQRNAQHAMQEQKKMTDERDVELLKLVSQPLMSELHFELHMRHLEHHPFLRLYAAVNPGGMRRVCHTAISFARAHQGDILFGEFEVPPEPHMLFILDGKLTYGREDADESDIIVAQRCNRWAAEAVLWTSWAHVGTLRAENSTSIMLLDAACFQQIIHTFPTSHAHCYATEFVGTLNRQSNEQKLTDIGEATPELDQMVERIFCQESAKEKEADAPKRTSLKASNMVNFLRRGTLDTTAGDAIRLQAAHPVAPTTESRRMRYSGRRSASMNDLDTASMTPGAILESLRASSIRRPPARLSAIHSERGSERRESIFGEAWG